MTSDEVIRTLGLAAHPEGGFYKELYRADADGRSPITSIYFLLDSTRPSHWHRIDASEIWYYHAGAALELRTFDGEHESFVLGADLVSGQRPQAVVPPNAWQAARTLGEWTLVGCAVGPGFDFSTFELAPADWSPE
ncbi:MAG: putative cupin superfamily sugar epimerase [Bradymonadia bacterium]